MPSILHLPYELVLFVIHHLDLSDISRLSRSCRRFQFLVREASIPKGLLEVRSHTLDRPTPLRTELTMVIVQGPVQHRGP